MRVLVTGDRNWWDSDLNFAELDQDALSRVEEVARDEALDAIWEERAERLAKLRCVNGHQWQRRSSMHLGTWSACLRCGSIRHLVALR